MLEGVINLDKPPGMSSARAVSRVKRLLPRGTKVGHAGTLDPFATGVLLVLVGKATKLCERLMDEPKRYEATVKFGATTSTDDPTVEEASRRVDTPPTAEQIDDALHSFIGEIQQRPPVFSALKIGGRPAYDLARKGKTVELAVRTVRVYAIEATEYAWPLLKLKVDCGRGTYVRAIARDLGEALGVGGYLAALRRTRVGPFHIEDAVKLSDLEPESIEGLLKSF